MTPLFPLNFFAADTVADLTGLSLRQLYRWDRSGFFVPYRSNPGRRGPSSRIYSREQVITLSVIAELRRLGVPIAELTEVRDRLSTLTRDELRDCRLYIGGKRVSYASDGAEFTASNGKGVVEVDLAPLVTETEAAIERLRIRTPEQIGQVTRTRNIMHGVPVLAGTRIPTTTFAEFVREGYDDEWILRNFRRLTPTDIRAAVEFERARRGGVEGPSPAAG